MIIKSIDIKIFIIIILISSSFKKTLAQDYIDTTLLSNDLNLLIDSIADEDIIVGSPYFSSCSGKQYFRYKRLLELASNEELLMLLKHSNKTVDFYAFWGLTINGYNPPNNWYQSLFYDSTYVKVQTGDFFDYIRICDIYYEIVKNQELGSEQRRKMDSAIIYDNKIVLSLKSKVLEEFNPKITDYYQIRELAKNKKLSEAYIVLARFNKDEDIGLFMDLLKNEETVYYGVYSVIEFPADTFYQELIKIHDNIICQKTMNYSLIRALYQALVQYPSKETCLLLKLSIKETKGFSKRIHKQYIWLAIDKYPNDIFNDIKSKIKLNSIDSYEVEKERNIEKTRCYK